MFTLAYNDQTMEKVAKRHEVSSEQPTIVVQQIGGVIQAVVIILLIVCIPIGLALDESADS